MLPVPSAFSRPPMRCSSPGVPGIAHGRASVWSSRRNGQKSSPTLGWDANDRLMSGSLSTDGILHGSAPLARYPSERRITGVMYLSAMRAASSAAQKHDGGEYDATIGTGASPCRPNMACRRSACSVLVGSPVDGPPRWMSQTISGSSSDTASPIVSDFRATPGPEVVVTPRAPPNAAPSAASMPAISSSAWNVRTPNRLCFESSCRMSDAGVIGYDPRNNGNPLRCEAVISPYARARLPVMLRYRPGGSGAGLTSYETAKSSVVSP